METGFDGAKLKMAVDHAEGSEIANPDGTLWNMDLYKQLMDQNEFEGPP